ncbi:SDR family oxidoreductase [Pantoea sp. Al-1710]|uniref:SDR family oxidoreductase n=1 Tax=Candidatus Pantoea communis TaxID=2608354 RepID=A0ABX0RNZ5_9GAMM|nr:SDR family oxidoreductase [Pantoea communis]NIG19335.1 SDR family oxidoreductase [Pantoea communis]
MSLKGKTYIVTGSYSGIGYASAEEIIRQGGKVILTATERHSRLLQESAQRLGEESTRWIAADLSDKAATTEIVNFAFAQFGAVHGLVNNAAYFPRNDLSNVDFDSFDTMMAVNVRAPLFLIKDLMAKTQVAGNDLTVVNIGSINAYCGQPDLLCYSISKGALQTMTRNLADAHAGKGLRINQLNVGWTLTQSEIDLQKNLGRPDDWHQHISPVFAPRGSILSPLEIASHVAFWLSDNSNPVNGSICDLEQYPVIGRNKIADN